MSAGVLRDKARAELQKMLDQETACLVHRTGDTVDEMRVRQGRIEGLSIAINTLDGAYSDMNR